MNLIDAHAHLNFRDFDSDRAEVIARTREVGVGVINVGTDLATSREVVALAEQHDHMWATVGIHPTDLPPADEAEKVFTELETLARHPRVVGIGECGLDYFHSEQKVRQAEVFERQIELAKLVNKPLMIHCRNAYEDLYALLVSDLRANVHFFAGDWATAKKFLDLGFTLSFTGVITFTDQYDEVIKNMPLERLLVETDCPFVAPVPYRGQRNEPSYVQEVVKRVAELRGLPVDAVTAQTLANTRRQFAI